MKEIWKDVFGYEGLYQVSNLGNVKSLNYNHTGKPKLLAKKNHKFGYLTVTLCKNGIRKNKSIHVLVASAFVPNADFLPCVNHIDGNKKNNTAKNLEWVSYKENTNHAMAIGLKSIGKPVFQYTKSGELLKTWPSVSKAARFYGCNPCTITNCTKERIRSCKGYVWRMAGD